MKKSLIALAVVALTAAPAVAQDAYGTGVGQSASQSEALSQSGAQSNITFNTPSRQVTEYSGTYEVRNAPGGIVGPGFSSGHPCAWAPVSGGITIIGGGIGAGGQRVDNACLLAQMGQNRAAVIMIAQRDRSACLALRAAGAIDPRSCGGDTVTNGGAPATSARPPAGRVALAVDCQRTDSGSITPIVTQEVAAAYSTTEIQNVCRTGS